MKEIGGYLEFESLINREYYINLIALNSGSNALMYIIMAKKIKKVYIPFYLCDSIEHTLNKNKIEYEHYNINKLFEPVYEKEINTDEYIYIVNYYGQITNDKILKLKTKYKNIIIDNTQAFFQKPLTGISTLYSCRKFFGVPDGAYLSTDALLDCELILDKSKDRMEHLLGRFEGCASDYYSAFKENDEKIEHTPLKSMSKITHNILGAVDYNLVLDKRNMNYEYLKKELGQMNLLKLEEIEGPFAYPFYIENTDIDIRKELAKKKIYIPTLWPNVLQNSNKQSIEYKYTKNIMPLPCDQRYGISSMRKIVEEIKKCIY